LRTLSKVTRLVHKILGTLFAGLVILYHQFCTCTLISSLYQSTIWYQHWCTKIRVGNQHINEYKAGYLWFYKA